MSRKPSDDFSVSQTVNVSTPFENEPPVVQVETTHYSHLDKDSKRPQFKYCKIQDLEALKTLLSQQEVSLTTEKATAGQVGHSQGFASLDPQLRGCASVQQNKAWASSSVRFLLC